MKRWITAYWNGLLVILAGASVVAFVIGVMILVAYLPTWGQITFISILIWTALAAILHE